MIGIDILEGPPSPPPSPPSSGGLDPHPWWVVLGSAYKSPNATALVEHRADGTTKTVSVRALQEAVKLVAAVCVHQYGLQPKEVIGMHIERGEAYTVLLLTCSYLGCYALPMPTDYPDDRLAIVATTAGAKLVCVAMPLPKVGAGAARLGDVCRGECADAQWRRGAAAASSRGGRATRWHHPGIIGLDGHAEADPAHAGLLLPPAAMDVDNAAVRSGRGVRAEEREHDDPLAVRTA